MGALSEPPPSRCCAHTVALSCVDRWPSFGCFKQSHRNTTYPDDSVFRGLLKFRSWGRASPAGPSSRPRSRSLGSCAHLRRGGISGL